MHFGHRAVTKRRETFQYTLKEEFQFGLGKLKVIFFVLRIMYHRSFS